MNAKMIFYLCPTCFYASESAEPEHEHTLLRVHPALPSDERRKPMTDHNGQILSAAPRWFYEAIIQARVAPRSP